MIGTCILALVFSPIFAEFLVYFNHDCRGFLRSDKTMTFGSISIEPRTFRAIVFFIIFIVLYPTLRWLAGDRFSWRADLGYTVSYLCFMEIIENVIIYINKDEEAKKTPKEPFPDWFSVKTRLVLLSLVILIGSMATPLIWSNCFAPKLAKNPAAFVKFLKKIPKPIKKQAVWFATH